MWKALLKFLLLGFWKKIQRQSKKFDEESSKTFLNDEKNALCLIRTLLSAFTKHLIKLLGKLKQSLFFNQCSKKVFKLKLNVVIGKPTSSQHSGKELRKIKHCYKTWGERWQKIELKETEKKLKVLRSIKCKNNSSTLSAFQLWFIQVRPKSESGPLLRTSYRGNISSQLQAWHRTTSFAFKQGTSCLTCGHGTMCSPIRRCWNYAPLLFYHSHTPFLCGRKNRYLPSFLEGWNGIPILSSELFDSNMVPLRKLHGWGALKQTRRGCRVFFFEN